jgi:hypothetical protein
LELRDVLNTSLAASVARDHVKENHPNRSFEHSVTRPAYMEEDVLTAHGLSRRWDDVPGEPRERANSEHDHYRGVVKRNNLVELFLDQLEVDKFVATHLFGEI